MIIRILSSFFWILHFLGALVYLFGAMMTPLFGVGVGENEQEFLLYSSVFLVLSLLFLGICFLESNHFGLMLFSLFVYLPAAGYIIYLLGIETLLIGGNMLFGVFSIVFEGAFLVLLAINIYLQKTSPSPLPNTNSSAGP